MKPYLILRSFIGSQNGIDSESFEAGTTRQLSESLVKALGGESGGLIKDAQTAAAEIANAPLPLANAVLDAIAGSELQPRELAEREMLEEGSLPEGSQAQVGEPVEPADLRPVDPAELRETKVVTPEETKPAKPLAKMSKAELVAHALTVHGIELTPDSMTIKQMLEAIEAAKGNA